MSAVSVLLGRCSRQVQNHCFRKNADWILCDQNTGWSNHVVKLQLAPNDCVWELCRLPMGPRTAFIHLEIADFSGYGS